MTGERFGAETTGIFERGTPTGEPNTLRWRVEERMELLLSSRLVLTDKKAKLSRSPLENDLYSPAQQA